MELDLLNWICLLLLGIATLLLVKRSLRPPYIPPGPYGLPLLGCLPFLGNESYKTLHQLSKKYGSIVSLYMGRRLLVVLNDANVVKDLFSTEPFLDRPERPPNNLLPDTKTFTASNGSEWREQRRFAMHCLRDMGFGITRLEKHIKGEIEFFLTELRKFNGRPCDLGHYLRCSMSNNILVLVFGRKRQYDDPTKLFIDSHIRLLTSFFSPTGVHAYFPWIIPFLSFFRIWNYHNLSRVATEMDLYLKKEIAEHQRTFDKTNIRDYTDEFLLKMEEARNDGRSNSYTSKMLKGNCLALMAASVDPSLNTIQWLILTMAMYPEVQQKVQRELDSVIGRAKLPEWSDRANLPYTVAAFMELQRWKTVIPLTILRCTSKGFDYKNYHIPKGSFVTANLWSIHRDERYWESPSEYRPERFIDENGKLVAKPDSFMPFSFGKRGCPGENLGKIEVYLYFTNVLHRFHVRLPEGLLPKDYVPLLGIAQDIKELKLCLIPRS